MAKYFSDEEVAGLDVALVIMLDKMRESAGLPIVITCGLRDPEHNSEVGGKTDSAHLTGLAADIRCPDSQTRFALVKGALVAGFTRIEVGTEHIHVDIDSTKPQNVIFLGVSS